MEREVGPSKVGIILLAIFCFLLLSGPYLIQIRKETGRWAISKKFVISVESSSREEGAQSIESFTKRKEISLLSLVKNPLIVLKKVVVGFLKSLYVFQQAYNPILFFFALLVPVFFRDSLIPVKGNLYLFAYFFFFLGLVLPFLWVARRYASYMIPIAIPWAAIGFLDVAAWTSKRFKGSILQKKIPVLLLIVVLVRALRSGKSDSRTGLSHDSEGSRFVDERPPSQRAKDDEQDGPGILLCGAGMGEVAGEEL